VKLLALLVGLALLGVATPTIVHAQPVPTAERPNTGEPGQPGRTITVKQHPHDDIVESHGRGMALLFWLFAAVTIGGAVFAVSRRNLIAAVMGMVGSFIGIAAVYMMLYAQFLAVIQMLVYAGAIMVLFVFVVMILNRPEDEPVAPTGRAGQALGGLAILYLVGRLAMLMIHVELPNKAAALAAPPAVLLPPASTAGIGETAGWGTVKAVGSDLFNGGLFPFEAISILLLVAVVGAIAIAKPLHNKDGVDTADTEPPSEGQHLRGNP
jgi:NADH-quinone oxidoreductase subunit J